MDALKVESASLVGLSMGGRIALDFAIASPARVRSLVLVDPGMPGFPFIGRDWLARTGESYRARRAGDARGSPTSSSGRGSPGRTARPRRSTRPSGRRRSRWRCPTR